MLTGMPSTRGGEVGAVVEVEAAQEILVGLAVAAVLGDDEARHDLEHFAGAQDGAILQLLDKHRSLAGGVHLARELLAARRNGDLIQARSGNSARRGAKPGAQAADNTNRGDNPGALHLLSHPLTSPYAMPYVAAVRLDAKYELFNKYHTNIDEAYDKRLNRSTN